MDYIYDCHTFVLTGTDFTDAALMAADLTLTLIDKFESNFMKEFGGNAIYNQNPNAIPNPVKKERKKPKTKKPLKIEDKI